MPSTKSCKTSRTKLETGFEQKAQEYLELIQEALRALIETIPGVTRRPTDLHKTVNVNVSLAWQVHRFAFASDPMVEVHNLPGSVAMERFLAAAGRRGAPAEAINRVRQALATFEELGNRHAANRKEFASLLSGFAEEGSERIDLGHRRAAYEAQSHLLGYCANENVCCFLRAPSRDDPTKIDGTMLRTITGVRRYRRDATIVVASMLIVRDDGTSPSSELELIEPLENPKHYGIVPEFCSEPLPVVAAVDGSGESVNVELRPPGLGSESAVTCTTSHCIKGHFDRYRTSTDVYGFSITRVRIPCKVLVQDTLVYRGLFEPTAPTVMAMTDHRDVDTARFDRPCDLLPSRVGAVFMGSGVESLKVEEVSHYHTAVLRMIEKMGWCVDDFDIYRVRIEYPLMPSSLFTRFELRESPSS